MVLIGECDDSKKSRSFFERFHAAVSAAPWLRSGGCARELRRSRDSHFFKSAAASVFEAEAELQDTRLTLVEGFEYISDLFFEKLVGSGVGRRECAAIFDEVS